MACPEGLEPPTPSLEGWCSIQLSYGQRGEKAKKRDGRGGGIRTRDLLVPNQLRYQAALHPEQARIVLSEAAASFLKVHGVTRRDEVEQLREDFNGFFISAPNGMIHLVIGPEET